MPICGAPKPSAPRPRGSFSTPALPNAIHALGARRESARPKTKMARPALRPSKAVRMVLAATAARIGRLAEPLGAEHLAMAMGALRDKSSCGEVDAVAKAATTIYAITV